MAAEEKGETTAQCSTGSRQGKDDDDIRILDGVRMTVTVDEEGKDDEHRKKTCVASSWDLSSGCHDFRASE